jgi:hypothetical protein
VIDERIPMQKRFLEEYSKCQSLLSITPKVEVQLKGKKPSVLESEILPNAIMNMFE